LKNTKFYGGSGRSYGNFMEVQEEVMEVQKKLRRFYGRAGRSYGGAEEAVHSLIIVIVDLFKITYSTNSSTTMLRL